MPSILVHNISDRVHAVDAHSVTIGSIQVRPGKWQLIPEESINSKHYKLHGKLLWFGNLPSRLIQKKKAVAIDTSAMSQEDAKAYLLTLDLPTLQNLGKGITPAVTSTTRKGYIYSILNACFDSSFDLDPEDFSWLRRWKKMPNGDYLEK